MISVVLSLSDWNLALISVIIWTHIAEGRFLRMFVIVGRTATIYIYLIRLWWRFVSLEIKGYSPAVTESKSTANVEMPTLTDTFQLSMKPGWQERARVFAWGFAWGKAQPFSSALNKWLCKNKWEHLNGTKIRQSAFIKVITAKSSPYSQGAKRPVSNMEKYVYNELGKHCQIFLRNDVSCFRVYGVSMQRLWIKAVAPIWFWSDMVLLIPSLDSQVKQPI